MIHYEPSLEHIVFFILNIMITTSIVMYHLTSTKKMVEEECKKCVSEKIIYYEVLFDTYKKWLSYSKEENKEKQKQPIKKSRDKAYRRFNKTEREKIFALARNGASPSAIAKIMKENPKKISQFIYYQRHRGII